MKPQAIKTAYITELVNSGMSQQEAEEKWNEISPFVDENGIYNNDCHITDCLLHDIKILGLNVDSLDIFTINNLKCFRPKSLDGIEANNGWTRIESEKDLPSEDISCWLELTNGRVLLAIFHFERQIFYGFNFPYTINEVSAYSEIKQPSKRIY